MPLIVHDRLNLICFTPKQHARSCNYWYAIESCVTSYTAFRTREALEFFLEVNHLKLKAPLPDKRGTHAYIGIEGRTRHMMHNNYDDMPTQGRRILKMSNGDYTLGIVEEDAEGAIVHYLNPNLDRVIFDPAMARAHEDAGHKGPLEAIL
jgi:hypothetical protein